MSGVSNLVERLRSSTIDRLPALRPAYPPVALEIGHSEIVLVRLKKRGRGKPELVAHRSVPMPEDARATSIFRPTLGSTAEIVQSVRRLLDDTGTKPGRLSIVLPDNLAKVSILHLPEAPGSRKQLDEIVRFKLRRAIPFRLEEARITYQAIPGAARGIDILVVVMRRFAVEQYESIATSVGARAGLVDLSTPNILNLARSRVAAMNGDGGDVAVLNCAAGYFTLVIVRGGRVIFFRSKSLPDDLEGNAAHDLLGREIAHSLAYYRDKLEGKSLERAVIRSATIAPEIIEATLTDAGFSQIELLDPSTSLQLADGVRLDPGVAQRIAPSIGAAAGRTR